MLTIVYASVFYPSFFGAKPKLKSSRAISFLNLTFGFIIFGLLWNTSLTKKVKGTSSIVLIVLTALSLAGMILNLGTLVFQGLSYTSQSTATQQADKAASSDDASKNRKRIGNITFSYPESWISLTEEDLDPELTQIFGQKAAAVLNVGPEDQLEISFTALSIPDFAYSFEDFKKYAESIPQYKTEIVTIDGHEAIKVDASNDTIANIIVFPNIEGKITSCFSASYPVNDKECLAVLNSVKIR